MSKALSRNRLFIMFHDQKGKCAYCDEQLIEDCRRGMTPQVDHIIAKKNGGGGNKDNLCLSCSFCNRIKSTKTVEEFVEYMRPVIEGKCSRKEIVEYNNWILLNKKFNRK